MSSLVLIIPAILKDDANKIAANINYGDSTFSVATSFNGHLPAAAWGARTDASSGFIDWLIQGINGKYPQIPDIDSNIVADVFDNLIIDVSDELWGYEHFINAIEKEGLQIAFE